mgnify:FL=1
MKNKLYEGRKLDNFRELVHLYKTTYKDKTAFEYKLTPDSSEYITKSYEQFASDIEDLGTYLLKNNCKRIAVIGNNRYEWCVTYLGTTTAGLVIVPLDKSLPDNEIIGLIRRAKVDTIVFDNKYSHVINSFTDDNLCKNKICMDTDFADVLKQGANLDHSIYDNVTIDESAMAVMLFTSGTTSISKAVMLSQHAICTDIYGLSQMIDITMNDKFLSFLPLHHVFESICTFIFGTSCGITIAFCDGLKYIQKNLVEYHVTGFVCVPLMLEIMFKKIEKTIEKEHKTFIVNILRKLFRHSPINIKRKIFKSVIDGLGGNLRTIISGGAPMDKTALQGFNDFGFDIHQGYGLTETASVVAGENSFSKKVGSVGFVLPTVSVRIDNPDKDGIGEIVVKTDSIMLGYYENEEATKQVLHNGEFYTGDLGYVDKNGFLFITGRKKDMIVLKNGKKVFPEELESLINKLPYVAESMVFGHIDHTKTDRNDDVVLYSKIVYNKDLLKTTFSNIPDNMESYKAAIHEDIKNKINKQMPAYKYIRHIIITDVPLIKTTTQKIKRNEEMKLIEKDLGSN